jgi:hypothetical protein
MVKDVKARFWLGDGYSVSPTFLLKGLLVAEYQDLPLKTRYLLMPLLFLITNSRATF